jgi:DegV family protein with EDD domain
MKNKISVITDTDSSLPVDIATQLDIRQVPITIHFPDSSYTTGVDINDRLLFEIIDRENKLPTTAAPSPNAFATAFEDAFTGGAETIFCICVSSNVSATYNSAISAQGLFPGKEIIVIDSLNLSMGQGFMALAAAEAAREGADKEEIKARVDSMRKRLHTFALLSTLKYLALSGRVGKLVAGMADTLNIKPILTVRDGKLELLERIRTRKNAVARLLDLSRFACDGNRIDRLAILHVNDLEGAEKLQELLCGILPCPERIIMAEFTPGLSVHAGNGVIGTVILTN